MLTPPHAATPLAATLAVLLPDHVLAYIGPGAGLGGLAIAIALVVGVLFLVIGLVWYPLKRVLKARTGDADSSGATDEPE